MNGNCDVCVGVVFVCSTTKMHSVMQSKCPKQCTTMHQWITIFYWACIVGQPYPISIIDLCRPPPPLLTLSVCLCLWKREDASWAKLIDSSINRRTNECHNCLSHCSSLISEYRILVLFVCNLQWIGWWPSQHHHHSPFTMIILKVCMILALSNLSSTLLVSEPLLYAGDIIAIDNKR